MPRSNRKKASNSPFQQRNVRYVSQQPEVKLTKEQLEKDKEDQKKFFIVLGVLTVAILIIIYFLFIRNL